MKELTELIYNIDENRKFMVVFSLPRKWHCFCCEDDNRWRVREGKPPLSFRTRVVGITFWRNFFYSMRYPNKEKYEDKVVPVITSWNLVCESGHLIICDNTGYSHTRPYRSFAGRIKNIWRRISGEDSSPSLKEYFNKRTRVKGVKADLVVLDELASIEED